ncbi:hypothetical protein [Ktedonobacter racemifer]|uniref:hypothetical protein n=1 Tax=Ktedonobacter racemifer TaxID=363277 RepID=UPI00058AFDF1|nr:hypothetical protein [Ktedonobacter racemifer]
MLAHAREGWQIWQEKLNQLDALPKKKLVAFAKQSGSSGRAIVGRSVSLRVLCDQLEYTQANLARLNALD